VGLYRVVNRGVARADGAQQMRHLAELDGQQLAEQRTHIDAGKEIARTTRPLVSAGVVAELGIVQRTIHERGDRHRAALTDALEDLKSEI
jgi:hypothetical protein